MADEVITIRRVPGKPSNYAVLRHGAKVATIRKASIDERSDWGDWMLIHASGRIDRHHGLGEARSDAMKLAI